jgi:hypothetical protein
MVYVVAVISAAVTGALFALGFRTASGIDHPGILFAVGIMGAGLQTALLLGWYLHYLRGRAAREERTEPSEEGPGGSPH